MNWGWLPACVVVQTSDTPDATYAEVITHLYYVIDDDLCVAKSAIPEFTTVIAGIVVAGLYSGSRNLLVTFVIR